MLFVCVANSCRSQMAEAFAAAIGGSGWEVWSAGSSPSGQVHPVAIRAMQELGYDLRTHRSRGLADVPQRTWDYVVTMGCGDHCPSIQARHRLEWAIPDPVGLPFEHARRIRDEMASLVRTLWAQVISEAAGRVSHSETRD